MTQIEQTRPDALPEAALRETFGDPQAFGVSGPVPIALRQKIAKAILTVAGADGKISEREWTRFTALAARVGMPPEGLEALSGFDAMAADIGDYFDDETRPMAKLILFEAIKVARADGYGVDERDAAHRAAKMLGVAPETVTAIEGLVELEEVLAQARMDLLRPTL